MTVMAQIGRLSCSFLPWNRADGRVFDRPFAFDTETTPIVGHQVPDYILGAACDGQRGFFLRPDRVVDFLIAHRDIPVIFHNCPFDLAVLNRLLGQQNTTLDVYNLVDKGQVWDTQIMHRLFKLATEGTTHQGKGQSTLEACVRLYLDADLTKDARDEQGNDVRTSWNRWLGRPLRDIPRSYLGYLATDALATYGCFETMINRINEVLDNCYNAWGYVDQQWLANVRQRYGPLTHHLQVKAAVVLEEIERVGFGLDQVNRTELLSKLEEKKVQLQEELRKAGYLHGQKGSQKTLQTLIGKAVQRAGAPYPLTETGKYSMREEDLDTLAQVSDFFATYMAFRQTSSLITTYLEKMHGLRIHPRYDLLKNTGRTSSRGPNIQGFPKPSEKKDKADFNLRSCFVPAKGKLFYIPDYATIELRTLSQALMMQFGLDSHMAEDINTAVDLHRVVAARMKAARLPNGAAILADPVRLAELERALTKAERNAAKPANFGLPAGMGARTFAEYARAQYGQACTEEEAHDWKQAWLTSFPEMQHYLRDDNFDAGLALAEELDLTPRNYACATGHGYRPSQGDNCPAGWLGGMALKVLRDENPTTRNGNPYDEAQRDYFWSRLQRLESVLESKMARDLRHRKPSNKLSFGVKQFLDRQGVMTLTGRLRAKARYSARRNTIFQGLAADGAKLALYRLWRNGFVVVAFIHDEVIVEVDASADLAKIKRQIDGILVDAMRQVCPDIQIEVEGSFWKSWGKGKGDEVPLPPTADAASSIKTGTHVGQGVDIDPSATANPASCTVAVAGNLIRENTDYGVQSNADVVRNTIGVKAADTVTIVSGLDVTATNTHDGTVATCKVISGDTSIGMKSMGVSTTNVVEGTHNGAAVGNGDQVGELALVVSGAAG
jgi:DNA polymerase I-like protein with 3'-5' exonuclease and polymerase domains